MIVVATRQSASPRRNSSIVRSSSRLVHLPVRLGEADAGAERAQPLGGLVQASRSGCGGRRPGRRARPRAGSPCAPAPRRRGRRRCGSAGGPPAASRSPRCRAGPRGSSAACAGSASPTSRARRPCSFSWRSSSFCRTPKRCSSSTISRPSSSARTSRESSRWVPIRMSTLPSAKPRERRPDLGRLAQPRDHLDLDREVRAGARGRCRGAAGRGSWSAPASSPACRPATAFWAARSATSVLP